MLVNDREELRKLFITIKGYNTQLERKVSEIALSEAEFEKEMGDVCPLCNQPIKHGKDKS